MTGRIQIILCINLVFLTLTLELLFSARIAEITTGFEGKKWSVKWTYPKIIEICKFGGRRVPPVRASAVWPPAWWQELFGILWWLCNESHREISSVVPNRRTHLHRYVFQFKTRRSKAFFAHGSIFWLTLAMYRAPTRVGAVLRSDPVPLAPPKRLSCHWIGDFGV